MKIYNHELLIFLFFLCALVYSSAGLGGGSSYIALLALFGISYQRIPSIALLCNIVVVTGGAFYFIRGKHFRWKLLLPFAITSVPLAHLCGRFNIDKRIFFLIVAILLFIISLKMLLFKKKINDDVDNINPKRIWLIGLPIGLLLGALSGIIGIGGGIFLAPVLHLFRWGTAKQIAATCSIFILANSLSGLAGHLSKQISFEFLSEYSLLFLAVFTGGQIGAVFGARKISAIAVKKITAVLIGLVSIRLFIKLA